MQGRREVMDERVHFTVLGTDDLLHFGLSDGSHCCSPGTTQLEFNLGSAMKTCF